MSLHNAYIAGKVCKSRDCIETMLREGLYEADVEKIIMETTSLGDGSGTSGCGHHIIHFVICGTSTKGAEVCCKISKLYKPTTTESIEWMLTAFGSKKDGQNDMH